MMIQEKWWQRLSKHQAMYALLMEQKWKNAVWKRPKKVVYDT